jgi:imidazolonepropionase-like amidohydrolase
MRPCWLACLIALGLSPVGLQAETTLICERLIDVREGAVKSWQAIVIEGDRIKEVLPVSQLSESEGTTIRLEDQTCMPGLMDMHVHLISETSPDGFAKQFKWNPTDYAYGSVKFAERTLQAGFTLVRDLGASDSLAISLRNAIERGDISGPRVLAAGKSIATTGGHADPSNGRNLALMGDPGPAAGVVNGVVEARKAVRQRYKEGSDLIKITATGGVLSQAKNGQNPQFKSDELEAIIDTAKDYGFKVAAHAHGAEGMLRAVEAGVDSIEHGTFMNEPVMKAMKKRGTYYVPTIIAGKFVAEKAEIDGFFSDLVRPKAREVGPTIQGTFAKAYAYGVKIAFGTDTGVSAHGDNWKEFVYMVEAGMPPMEAIQSATIEGADLADVADRLGVIEAGKLADLVAVRGNPIERIAQMGEMTFVMKGGEIYRHLD